MVHEKICKCPFGKSEESLEFYVGSSPQYYCLGWIADMSSNEPMECCNNCKDFVLGEEIKKDIQRARKEHRLGKIVNYVEG